MEMQGLTKDYTGQQWKKMRPGACAYQMLASPHQQSTGLLLAVVG